MKNINIYLVLFSALVIKGLVLDVSWPVAMIALGLLGLLSYSIYDKNSKDAKSIQYNETLENLKNQILSFESKLALMGLIKRK